MAKTELQFLRGFRLSDLYDDPRVIDRAIEEMRSAGAIPENAVLYKEEDPSTRMINFYLPQRVSA